MGVSNDVAASYMRRRRTERIKAGLCPQCGVNPRPERGGSCADCKERHTSWRRANPNRIKAHRSRSDKALRDAILERYGKVCACCGEAEERFLTLDHKNNDGHLHRKEVSNVYRDLKKKGFPDGYETLCFNCNFGRALNGGVCPHKLAVK
jgi:hypothetical protein